MVRELLGLTNSNAGIGVTTIYTERAGVAGTVFALVNAIMLESLPVLEWCVCYITIYLLE